MQFGFSWPNNSGTKLHQKYSYLDIDHKRLYVKCISYKKCHDVEYANDTLLATMDGIIFLVNYKTHFSDFVLDVKKIA